jgi:hypothetical protein
MIAVKSLPESKTLRDNLGAADADAGLLVAMGREARGRGREPTK